ncbi:MAG: hypothetical protein K2X47_11470, partial [Bdellovibrionales bacterium]|nr:hypothetical protein [Bdellovibrionales bacterium]
VPLKVAFRAPKVYPTEPIDGHQHTLLLQEWVNGVSFEKIKSENPVHARRIFQSFARLWISKALFKGFHYDIHAGNILILKVSETEFVFYLLDHGMFAVLEEGRAIALASTAAAVHRKNPELMAKSIWNLSDEKKNQIPFSEFQTGMAAYVQAKGEGPLQLHSVLGEALRKGVVLPPDMNRLSRGLTGLAMLGKWLGATISTSEIAIEILTKNLSNVASTIGLADLSGLPKGQVSPALRTAAHAIGIHALATGKGLAGTLASGASGLWDRFKNRNTPNACSTIVQPGVEE